MGGDSDLLLETVDAVLDVKIRLDLLKWATTLADLCCCQVNKQSDGQLHGQALPS